MEIVLERGKLLVAQNNADKRSLTVLSSHWARPVLLASRWRSEYRVSKWPEKHYWRCGQRSILVHTTRHRCQLLWHWDEVTFQELTDQQRWSWYGRVCTPCSRGTSARRRTASPSPARSPRTRRTCNDMSMYTAKYISWCDVWRYRESTFEIIPWVLPCWTSDGIVILPVVHHNPPEMIHCNHCTVRGKMWATFRACCSSTRWTCGPEGWTCKFQLVQDCFWYRMMIVTLLDDEVDLLQLKNKKNLDGGVLQFVPERAEQPLKRMSHKYHCHTWCDYIDIDSESYGKLKHGIQNQFDQLLVEDHRVRQ